MKTLHMLTAAASLLLAVSSSPSLSASRTQARAADANAAYARDNSDNAYTYSPYLNDPWGAPRASSRNVQTGPAFYGSPAAGQNLPYADRPYGNPDSW